MRCASGVIFPFSAEGRPNTAIKSSSPAGLQLWSLAVLLSEATLLIPISISHCLNSTGISMAGCPVRSQPMEALLQRTTLPLPKTTTKDLYFLVPLVPLVPLVFYFLFLNNINTFVIFPLFGFTCFCKIIWHIFTCFCKIIWKFFAWDRISLNIFHF